MQVSGAADVTAAAISTISLSAAGGEKAATGKQGKGGAMPFVKPQLLRAQPKCLGKLFASSVSAGPQEMHPHLRQRPANACGADFGSFEPSLVLTALSKQWHESPFGKLHLSGCSLVSSLVSLDLVIFDPPDSLLTPTSEESSED